jgi:hypothetical protein
MKVYEYNSSSQLAGYFNLKLTAQELANISGVSIVKVETGDGAFYKRVIRK